MSSSSSAIVRASSASARFRSARHAGYFTKLDKFPFTESRSLDQSRLKWEVEYLFENTSLLTFLKLACAYNSIATKEIYANMDIDPDLTKIQTRVMNKNVVFTKEDLHTYLDLSTTGESVHAQLAAKTVNWKAVNRSLREIDCDEHIKVTKGLITSARVIEHILRNSILPKAGDRDNITPVLSLTTYFILESIPFDAAGLIIGYISSVMSARTESTSRLQNLGLGHMFAFLMERKYNLIYPTPADYPPVYFSNGNFTLILKKRPQEDVAEGAAAEAAEFARQETVPPSASTTFTRGESSGTQPFDFSDLQEFVGHRIDTMGARVLSRLDDYQISTDMQLAALRQGQEAIRQDVRTVTDSWTHFWGTYYPDYRPPPPPEQ